MKNWENKRDSLLSVPLPNHGKTYTVIPHRVFIEEIEQEIHNQGYEIQSERYLSADKGLVATGTFQLKGTDLDIAPSLDWVNSYNKKKAGSMIASASVLVCKNGMMARMPEGSYTRKHMGNALEEFRQHIKQVVEALGKEFQRLVQNKEEMKIIDITPRTRALMVGDMFINEGMINPTQLNSLSRELTHSKNFKGDTVWDFYNNVTEALKDNHPLNYSKQLVKFHTYISDNFELTGSRGLYKKVV